MFKAISEVTDEAGGGNGDHSLHEQEVGAVQVAEDE